MSYVKLLLIFLSQENRINLMNEDKLFTKKEACEYLRISETTLNRLIKKEEISYIKLERKVLFRKSDIDNFLESRKIPKK